MIFSKKVEIVMQTCSKTGLLKIFGTILRYVLSHKVSQFMILAFHDFLIDPIIF